MKRYFCDRCQTELPTDEERLKIQVIAKSANGSKAPVSRTALGDYCLDCARIKIESVRV